MSPCLSHFTSPPACATLRLMGAHHAHHHGHGHGHAHGHAHDHGSGASRRRLGWAAVLTGAFMVAEVVGGLLSGSLALLADAGHMLTDFAALAMAWGAFAVMARGRSARLSYGWDRITVLVAFVNGLSLFAVALFIVVEAVERFLQPGDVLAGPMLAVAVAGLVVNLVVFRILMGADRENLNVRGAVLHVVGDLLGSVAAIAAAVVIMLTGWTPADPLLGVLVALLILRSAWILVRTSAHILLQGTPDGLDADTVAADLREHVPGLAGVAHLHSWAVTPDRPVMTLEVATAPGASREAVREAVKARLASQFHVAHATVEVRPAIDETTSCP